MKSIQIITYLFLFCMLLSIPVFYYFLDDQWNREMIGTWEQNIGFDTEAAPSNSDTVVLGFNGEIGSLEEGDRNMDVAWTATENNFVMTLNRGRAMEINIGFEKVAPLPPNHFSLETVDSVEMDISLHLRKLDMNLWGI